MVVLFLKMKLSQLLTFIKAQKTNEILHDITVEKASE